MKTRWLDRGYLGTNFYFCLCTSEKQFYDELKRLGIPRDRWPEFMGSESADATVWHFECVTQRPALIVCFKVNPERTPIEVAGLLVHEATHLWQRAKRDMNEENPGDEVEAYAIQHFSQQLMEAYNEQVNRNT